MTKRELVAYLAKFPDDLEVAFCRQFMTPTNQGILGWTADYEELKFHHCAQGGKENEFLTFWLMNEENYADSFLADVLDTSHD